MVGRSMTPSARTFSISPGSSMPAARMASQVRWMVRPTPVSPTNMWCASSVSMKRQELERAAQHGSVLARHLLPSWLAKMAAERNRAARLLRRQQDAPAVIGHLDVVELGPALGIDRDGGAQIDQRVLEALRPHVLPPVDIAR